MRNIAARWLAAFLIVSILPIGIVASAERS
jgi:hypothetical protein